jgi:hypothetical protein
MLDGACHPLARHIATHWNVSLHRDASRNCRTPAAGGAVYVPSQRRRDADIQRTSSFKEPRHMKIAKRRILSLMVGALLAGDRAFAAPDEEKYKKTQEEAHVQADKWRDEIKQSFQVAQKHEAHLKTMQDSSAKLRAFLADNKPCRDGAQAKEIESYIHGRFHTLYGSVVADIKHAVDLNCRDHKLAVTFWVTDFTPTAAMVAAEKGAAELDKSNKSMPEIEQAIKRILGNWATTVMPIITDNSKRIADIRTSLDRTSELSMQQINELSCPNAEAVWTAAYASVAAVMKELNQGFTNYAFDIICTGKKVRLIHSFTGLKRQGMWSEAPPEHR